MRRYKTQNIKTILRKFCVDVFLRHKQNLFFNCFLALAISGATVFFLISTGQKDLLYDVDLATAGLIIELNELDLVPLQRYFFSQPVSTRTTLIFSMIAFLEL